MDYHFLMHITIMQYKIYIMFLFFVIIINFQLYIILNKIFSTFKNVNFKKTFLI